MRVLLVSGSGGDRAALAAFERILQDGRDVWCERVDLTTAEREGLAGADCAVVFGRGLQIIGHWSAFDADAADDFQEGDCTAARVELGNAARWHPVLKGVGPFVLKGVPTIDCLRMDTTNLLIQRTAERVVPIVWARHGERRAVCTSLGRADDFRQPEFAAVA